MWMAIWHSHCWGSQWFRTNHHQESRFTCRLTIFRLIFLPSIHFKLMYLLKRGFRDEEHTVSFRDKMGQGGVPLSQQSSWLARLRACVGAHVQVHSCFTILQQEHYRRRLNMTSVFWGLSLNTAGFTENNFLCRELFFILFYDIFLPNKMFKIIEWARLDLWLYCRIFGWTSPRNKVVVRAAHLGVDVCEGILEQLAHISALQLNQCLQTEEPHRHRLAVALNRSSGDGGRSLRIADRQEDLQLFKRENEETPGSFGWGWTTRR